MAKRIQQWQLKIDGRTQPLNMQRRTQITHAGLTGARSRTGHLNLYGLVEEDANTKAFDVKHTRHFAVFLAGDVVPDDGMLVATVETFLVYEVKP